MIGDEWATKVTAAIAARDEAFRRAERFRTALRPVLTWKRAAKEFAKALLTAVF